MPSMNRASRDGSALGTTRSGEAGPIVMGGRYLPRLPWVERVAATESGNYGGSVCRSRDSSRSSKGARLPDPEEERALQLPSGVPVTRNIRTAYAGEQPVEVLDTISNGEVVSYRFEIQV